MRATAVKNNDDTRKSRLLRLAGAARLMLRHSFRGLVAACALPAALLLASAFIAKISLDSPVLKPGKPIPKRYAAGKDISPPLVWTGLPQGTQELVLIFEDAETSRVYWLLYRLSPKLLGLSEGVPHDEVVSDPPKIAGIIQGITDFRSSGPGYHGPDPPSGPARHYRFTIYALDARLGLQPGLDKTSLMILIQDRIIGKGELVVTCRKE